MEFHHRNGQFINGFSEAVEIEDRYLFPMLKSSALAAGKTETTDRWMLVTQSSIGQETAAIAENAPRTWNYLLSHAELLDRRKSSIYKNRPRFSIFGVGKYTFASWKVAISGFYKKLQFVKVGTVEGKPIILDDTAYFVTCHSEREADLVCSLLNSEPARRFFSALIFWDAKRPITVSVLKLLDLQSLAESLGQGEQLKACRAGVLSIPTQSVLSGHKTAGLRLQRGRVATRMRAAALGNYSTGNFDSAWTSVANLRWRCFGHCRNSWPAMAT